MIKARASGSKVYLYFMKKGRQARHRIPRNSCLSRFVIRSWAGPPVYLAFIIPEDFRFLASQEELTYSEEVKKKYVRVEINTVISLVFDQ